MRDRDNITRTGAKDPWGREAQPLGQWPVETRARLDAEPATGAVVEAGEGQRKLQRKAGMLGASLIVARCGKALPDMLALEPYRGKLAVRNLRGDDGNVGIIRSPLRAIVLPDLGANYNGASCCSTYCLRTDRGAPPQLMMQYDLDHSIGLRR